MQEAWLTPKKAEQNPVEENGLDSSVLPHCDFPHVENPDGENQAQLKTNSIKTNSNKKSVCLAEPTDRHHHKESKETDSLQKENRKENRNDAKQFMALEMLMKEHSGWDTMGQKLQKFTTDVISYLKKSVLSGAVSSAKMTSKLIDIFNQEGTLLNFIKKINVFSGIIFSPKNNSNLLIIYFGFIFSDICEFSAWFVSKLTYIKLS